MFDGKLFDRGSDVRGEYPGQINEELAWFVGRYLVTYLQGQGFSPPRVLVGRDGRNSSPAIYQALVQGIASAGGVVVPGGLATTDMVFWGAGSGLGGAQAGAMVTASHNPPQYNGIKMAMATEAGLQTIRPKVHLKPIFERDAASEQITAGAPVAAPFPASPGANLPARFTDWACEKAPDREQFDQRIVIDPGNGVGSLFTTPLRDRLPNARIDAIFGNIDGRFPNRPSNPGLAGAVDTLKQTVRESGAAFGAAFDGDADRLFMVDDQGGFVPGDQLLAAIARSILNKQPADKTSKPVVFAATCSWLMVDAVRKSGGDPVIARVGQETIKAGMQETQAVYGGESSAHFNFSDSYYQDSGLIALMTIWQTLHEEKKSLSQLMSDLAPMPHSGEINIRVKSDDWARISQAVIDRIRGEKEAQPDQCYVFPLDGVSVYHPFHQGIANVDELFPKLPTDAEGARYRGVHPDYNPDWWFSLRRSNNEPLVRLNVECRDKADLVPRTKALMNQIIEGCREIGDCPAEVEDWGYIGDELRA